MAILSSVYTDIATLDTHVSDTPTEDNKINMINLNDPGNVSVGDFLIAYVNYADGRLDSEGGNNTELYVSESGSLTTLQTGLNVNWGYNKTATGYVKMLVSGAVRKLEIKEYYKTSVKDVARVFEVLDDLTVTPPTNKSADYDFVYADLLILDNTMEAWIEGLDHAQNDTTGINIGTNGTSIYASYEISGNDFASLEGEEMYIRITVRQENSSGALITQLEGSRLTAGTLRVPSVGNLVINDSQITGSKIWVQIELGSEMPI